MGRFRRTVHPVRRPLALALALSAFTISLTACGGDSGGSAPDHDTPDTPGAVANEGTTAADPEATVKESGVGQRGQYATGIAVLEGNEAAAGYFVVVSMNFLDDAGEIIATETQTESFSWPNQRLIVPVFADLGDKTARVASVDPTVAISNEGGTTGDPLPELTTKQTRAEYGSTTAVFTLTNPTNEQLSSPRIGALCRDKASRIIGGGFDFPDLVPAAGTIKVDVDVQVGDTKPASCEATVNIGF